MAKGNNSQGKDKKKAKAKGPVKAAKKAGATREELAETVTIASALRAGAALTHGLLALKLYDKA